MSADVVRAIYALLLGSLIGLALSASMQARRAGESAVSAEHRSAR